MEHWFAGGRIVDLLIAFTIAEALALLAWFRLAGRGVRPREFLLNLLSGLCLMAALRCALAASAWTWIAGWLLLSGLAHGADMVRRWKR